jgi:hypothetical protein
MALGTLSFFVILLGFVLSSIYLRRQRARLERLEGTRTITAIYRFLVIESIRRVVLIPCVLTIFVIAPLGWMTTEHALPWASTFFLLIICALMGRILATIEPDVVALTFNLNTNEHENVGQRVDAYWDRGQPRDAVSLIVRCILPRIGIMLMHGLFIYGAIRATVKWETTLAGAGLLAACNAIFFLLCLLLRRVENDEKETAS